MPRIEIARELVYAGYGFATEDKAKEAANECVDRIKNGGLPVEIPVPEIWKTQGVWNYRIKGRALEVNETLESETEVS